MSFSWWLKDKSGRDLFAEFGVHHQALNLGPNSPDDTEATYTVSEIREAWISTPYKEELATAAKDALLAVQEMAKMNVDSLTPHHCETCSCRPITPRGWSTDDCAKLLAIPAERVWRAGGGF